MGEPEIRLQYPRCIEHPLLTCGVACLYHELFYHSVEDVSIVVPLAGVHTEVLYCLRTAANRYKNGRYGPRGYGGRNKGERGYGVRITEKEDIGDWNKGERGYGGQNSP